MTPLAKAQHGLALICDAMLDLLAKRAGGLPHAKIARALGLEMEYPGGKNLCTSDNPAPTRIRREG
jgi:hypothetical protein